MQGLASLDDPQRVALLMHPLRRRILEEAAAEAVSATAVARRVGETRQKVNYHLRALADAALLEPAGERPRRGVMEKLYRASARAYTLSPEVMGGLTPSADQFRDAFSAGTLLALAGRMQDEVVRSAQQAEAQGKRVASLSIEAEVRFDSAAQQAEFARALTQAVADVVARFTTPASAARGRRYRVVAGAYPIPGNQGKRER
jgi:DNA-binding transcriptional ArsR family regulator